MHRILPPGPPARLARGAPDQKVNDRTFFDAPGGQILYNPPTPDAPPARRRSPLRPRRRCCGANARLREEPATRS